MIYLNDYAGVQMGHMVPTFKSKDINNYVHVVVSPEPFALYNSKPIYLQFAKTAFGYCHFNSLGTISLHI